MLAIERYPNAVSKRTMRNAALRRPDAAAQRPYLSFHPHLRITVLESRPARTRHEFARTERFVFAPIQINLPTPQTVTRVDHMKAIAAENALHFTIGNHKFLSLTQTSLTKTRR